GRRGPAEQCRRSAPKLVGRSLARRGYCGRVAGGSLRGGGGRPLATGGRANAGARPRRGATGALGPGGCGDRRRGRRAPGGGPGEPRGLRGPGANRSPRRGGGSGRIPGRRSCPGPVHPRRGWYGWYRRIEWEVRTQRSWRRPGSGVAGASRRPADGRVLRGREL
ncbi:MAG: hypothetical protein AVDCRST_MAG28-1438, partial [uncultured Rubrobacteraceae bacterium]